MKRKFPIVSFLLFPFICAQSATITIENIDASKVTKENIRKIAFNEEVIVFEGEKMEGDMEKFVIMDRSNVQKIIFNGDDSKTPSIESENLKIYPNPAQEIVYVEGASKGTSISLFNLSGQELSTQIASEEKNEVNVSSLPLGTYLLRIGKKVVKIVKSEK